jgi:hypothetical protein
VLLKVITTVRPRREEFSWINTSFCAVGNLALRIWKELKNALPSLAGVVYATNNAKDIYAPVNSVV